MSDALRLENLSFAFGRRPTVDDVSLALPAGTFFALLGESGCGKSTLLKLVGGYLTPSAGRVVVGGRDLTPLPPERRDLGMVFQNYALFPHLTARANVAFGLEMRRLPRPEIARRVEAMLDLVGLDSSHRDRRPEALSGGQQQRVALARALVIEPVLLLLDEPLANLDRALRDRLRTELAALQRQTGVTSLFVTHDQDEALALADVVGVMSRGRLLQVGPPREVHDRPRCPHVARALGEVNLLDGGYLLRPGRVRLGESARSCAVTHTGRVRATTYRGEQVLVEVALADRILLATCPVELAPRPGESVAVGWSDDLWRIPEEDPV